jgi:hypothetical protein
MNGRHLTTILKFQSKCAWHGLGKMLSRLPPLSLVKLLQNLWQIISHEFSDALRGISLDHCVEKRVEENKPLIILTKRVDHAVYEFVQFTLRVRPLRFSRSLRPLLAS